MSPDAGDDRPGSDRSVEGPADRLSALLDGELPPAEQAEVEAYLARRPEARQELDELARMRSLVRSLPAVEPPFGFYERLLTPGSRRRSGHRWPSAMAALGVAAATIVLLVGVTPAADVVVPPVNAYADRHLDMMDGVGGSISPNSTPADSAAPSPSSTDPSTTDPAFTPLGAGELDAMGVPAHVASGYERMGGYAGDGGVTHIMYAKGTLVISVYQQPGLVEWSALPPNGALVQIGTDPAWDLAGQNDEIMVAEHGATIFTIVAVGDHDGMLEVLRAVPPASRPTMTSRMSHACRAIVQRFGFSE
jgi:hypothetical protein